MKDITIADLATILQLDLPVKENLIKNFPNYSAGLKEKIVTILWDSVFELKDRLAKIKYEQFLLEVGEGKRQLTTDLYQEAVKMVWQEFDDILAGKNKDVEKIEQIRSNLINLPNFSSSQKP